jgi:hypothetical protein
MTENIGRKPTEQNKTKEALTIPDGTSFHLIPEIGVEPRVSYERARNFTAEEQVNRLNQFAQAVQQGGGSVESVLPVESTRRVHGHGGAMSREVKERRLVAVVKKSEQK